MALYRDLLCTFCALIAAFGLTAGQERTGACTETRDAYRDKGFSANDVPPNAITSDDLRVCPSGYTCCTVNMESVLTQTSSAEFENVVYDKSSLLRDYFIRRTERYDNFIKELIVRSQANLDDMFTRTYDSMYQQNRDLFDDLYTNFRNYYYGRDIDLSEVMGDFFNQLFERIFQLLNPQYVYEDEFWSCTRQDIIMESLKPFGDVANTLIERAKKSFVAARTFGQGLGFGRDAVTRGSKVEPTPECRKALMRMSYCPHCKGIPFVKPCHSLCLNIMKGCLASQSEMDAEWNYYIDAMTMLGNRMDGILNIETFLLTIEIEISNGIMNMQNEGLSISTKVFNGCGIPSRYRQRRETDSAAALAASPNADEDLTMDDEEEMVTEALVAMDVPVQVSQGNVTKSTSPREKQGRRGLNGRQGRRGQAQRASGYRYPAPTTAAGTNLDRLVKDVLKRLRDTRPFWSALPYMICDDTNIAAEVTSTDENDCWNGERVGRYEMDIVGNGISNQRNNPEVTVALTKPVAAIRIQKERLETIIDILQLAQNGDDVPFVDHQGVDHGSGSGSGSGSGDGSTDPDSNLFPFSTDFEDPIYRPTRLPTGGHAPSIHRTTTSIVLSFVMATVASLISRWR